MREKQDIEWVKSTTNELNNLLQVITESSQFLEKVYGGDATTQKYFEIIRNGVDRAVMVTRQMLDRASQPPQSTAQHGSLPTESPALHEPAPRPSADSQSAIHIANPHGPRELILIVDDEDFVTLLAQRVLTDEGYRVITARDGLQALEIYRKLTDEISLVILDFTMPIMDGSEVFSEMRMLNPRVAVVLSSGFTEQEKLRWMLAKGLRGFIPKPYTQQKLLLQVRSVLDAIKTERK